MQDAIQTVQNRRASGRSEDTRPQRSNDDPLLGFKPINSDDERYRYPTLEHPNGAYIGGTYNESTRTLTVSLYKNGGNKGYGTKAYRAIIEYLGWPSKVSTIEGTYGLSNYDRAIEGLKERGISSGNFREASNDDIEYAIKRLQNTTP